MIKGVIATMATTPKASVVTLPPSAEDAQVTGEVSKAGLLLGIPLLDHIIIGSHCFASMKQLAPDLFTEKNGRPYDI